MILHYLIDGASSDTLTLESGDISLLPGLFTTSHEIATDVDLGANGTWAVNDSGNTITVSGDIGGNGDLAKTSSGALVLSGSNTFDGAVNVNAGTLEVGVNNTLSNNHVVTVADGATLRIADNEGFGGLFGTGSVVMNADMGVGHGAGHGNRVSLVGASANTRRTGDYWSRWHGHANYRRRR